MNRKTRNIIMIILLVLLMGATIFTVFHKERVMYGNQQGQPGMNGQMQPPPTPEGVPEGTTPPQPPGMGGQPGQPGMQPGMNMEVEMPTYFYYIFGAEGLGISLIIIFLIMSQMNKKSAKYVFSSSSKKMAYIVMSCALTALITFACVKIELPKREPPQPPGGPQGANGSVAYSAINEIF